MPKKRRQGRGKSRTSAKEPPSAKRRSLRWAGAALALVLLALGLAPRAAGFLVEDELGEALGARIEIGGLRGWTGRQVRLSGFRWSARGAARPLFAAREIRCHVDRPLIHGLPRRLQTLEILGPRFLWPPLPAAMSSSPVQATASEAAPGGPPEEAAPASALPEFLPDVIHVRHGRLDVRLGRDEGAGLLPLTDVTATIRRRGAGRMEITSLEGRLFGGIVRGDGSYDLALPERWRLQLRVAEVDLAEATTGTSLEHELTRGRLGAFLDLRGPASAGGPPRGAGWVSAAQSHVWQIPVFGGILDAFGLAAGHGDYFRQLRARFLLDDGRFHFEELIALGSPVSLYGNGTMNLDGRRIEADFVPRIGRGLLDELPVVGAPGQTLLDLFKGAALEVQVRGDLDHPRASVLPLPLITRPIQEFIALVGG